MQKLFEGSRKIIYFSSGIKSANKISGKRVGISFATLNRKNLKTLEIGTKRAKPVIAISKDHPLDVIDIIHDIVCPCENLIFTSQHRLDFCMRKLEKAKKLLPNLKADDFHGMMICHEAENMVLCTELMLRAASMRKESRGWFQREDYPETDNENWLKWICIKKGENGEMELFTEDVPIETYPFQLPVEEE